MLDNQSDMQGNMAIRQQLINGDKSTTSPPIPCWNTAKERARSREGERVRAWGLKLEARGWRVEAYSNMLRVINRCCDWTLGTG